MADTAFATWSAKRLYGADAAEVTWRPVTAIPLADTRRQLQRRPPTRTGCRWSTRRRTPSTLPDTRARTARRRQFSSSQFRRRADIHADHERASRAAPTRSISQARADGNDARVWGGMHYPSTVEGQRQQRRGHRAVRESQLHATATREGTRMSTLVSRQAYSRAARGAWMVRLILLPTGRAGVRVSGRGVSRIRRDCQQR